MIYVYRTLWVLFCIPIFLLECITFLLGIFISPFVNGIRYIKKGVYGDFYPEIISEYIQKRYDELREHIEKLKENDS